MNSLADILRYSTTAMLWTAVLVLCGGGLGLFFMLIWIFSYWILWSLYDPTLNYRLPTLKEWAARRRHGR